MQSPNLEQDPLTGDDCFDGARPCRLGQIPPYAVAVRSDSHVATALAFANHHGLRIVVKATGHEYQGRSTAANALLLWVHALKGISVDPAFTACPGVQAPRAALTARPGDSWGEAYAAADAVGAMVVGGSEISVSACGGYTQSGGHSWTGPAWGMAVDSVLQLTGVRADGSAFTASACANADLFWALRGGGGGTFAVLTSATYALHANPPAGVAGLSLQVQLLRGQQSAALLMDGWMYELANNWAAPGGNPYGVVGSGYFNFKVDNSPGGTSGFSAIMVFNGTVNAANAALGPISTFAQANPLDLKVLSAEVTPWASMLAWHRSWDPTSESTGGVSVLGSRLIPLSVMTSDSLRLALAVNLSEVSTYVNVEGLMVVGGAVAQLDADSTATSLNPAWRQAGLHIVIGAGWALNASLAEQASVMTGISELTQIMAQSPGMEESGAYWGESGACFAACTGGHSCGISHLLLPPPFPADFLELEWQKTFWGANYPRLQSIKTKEDPMSVFTCHHCVERS